MTLKTIHGQIQFLLQQYRQQGKSVSYFELCEPKLEHQVSQRLQEFAAYYSNRLSYQEVSELIERVSGQRLLSDQGIWQIVQRQALSISQAWQASVAEAVNSAGWVPRLATQTEVDLYDPKSQEILLFEDAIGVKRQAAQRGAHPSEPTAPLPEATTISTDVALLQTGVATFEYITGAIDAQGHERVPLATLVSAKVQSVYGSTPLPIVVITDGATVIRRHLAEMFTTPVPVILDWYHLTKRVREVMSMLALPKPDKQQHIRVLLAHLWRGQTQAALSYLTTHIETRRADKLAELSGYLEKHQHEIIHYQQRHQGGKSIGSGRMEKAVDQVIGRRQKRKGSSWRPLGSRALAILKVVELNGLWQQTWFPMQAN